ncbi:MAG: tetratricopeptide repeat protein [bacterium]
MRQSDYFSHPSVDEQEYEAWAAKIASGDVVGSGVFYASPVYPYFLGALFRIFGEDLFIPRVVQVVIGAARAPIAAAFAALSFGPAIGVATGVIVALYRTTLFYDVFLLKESLALFIQDIALFALALVLWRARRRTASAAGEVSVRALVLSGFLMGLAALAREYLAPLIACGAAILALHVRALERGAPMSVPAERATSGLASWRSPARAAALFAAGAAIALFPVAIRNLVVGGEFVLLSAQGGQNLYLGNSLANHTGLVTFPANVRSDPMTLEQDFRALASHRVGRALGPTEASNYWLRESLREMGSNPTHAITLLARKALLSISAFEVPNVLSIGYFSRISHSLAWNPVRFGLLFPLAALGIAAALRDRERRSSAAPALAALAVVFFALVAFYVSDRYRLPAVMPLAMFAAIGAASMWRVVVADLARAPRRIGRAAISCAIVVAFAALSRLPLLPEGSRGEAMPPANLGNSLAKEGRYEEAIARYNEAFAIEPDTDFALYGIAVVYGDLGRHAEAVDAFRKYIAKNPYSAQAYYSLGNTYFEMGRPDTALMAFEAAVRLEPYYAEAHFNMGAVRHGLGELGGAIDAYEAATRAAPNLWRAWNNLGVALLAVGRREEGVAALERALADTGYVEPRMNLADCVLRDDAARASELYGWVLAREKNTDALLGLARARASLGDAAAARMHLELFLRVAPPDDARRAGAEDLLRTLG